jgi:hypothetical protein
MQVTIVEPVDCCTVKGTNHVRSLLRQMQKENRNEESARSDHEEWSPRAEGDLLRLWNNGAEFPERQKGVRILLHHTGHHE